MRITQTVENMKKWVHNHRNGLLCAVFVLLTLPHFNLLNHYSEQVESMINCARIVSALVIGVWLLFIKRRLSPVVLVIGLWQGYLLLNTMIQREDPKDIRTCFVVAASILSVVMLYDLMQEEGRLFFSSQIFCFELTFYINLVTVFIFPNGLYASSDDIFGVAVNHYYFLGYDSLIFNYCIPALLILSLWKTITKTQKFRKILLVTTIYVTVFRVWAVAALTAICVMGAAYLFIKKLPSFLFNFYSVWLVQICFFVCVIWLRLQDYFRWLIDGVLGKWGALMGRIAIWDFTMEKISHAWLFGYGYADRLNRQMELNVYYGDHAHNFLLEALYEGGVVNLALFAIVILVAGKRVFRYRKTIQSKLITIAFLGWCLANLVDISYPLLYGMFVIAYYSNRDSLQPGEKDPLDIPKWNEWILQKIHLKRG